VATPDVLALVLQERNTGEESTKRNMDLPFGRHETTERHEVLPCGEQSLQRQEKNKQTSQMKGK
jgi:hypothetical protein